MEVTIFGVDRERIEFDPDHVTLRIRRGAPYKARGLTTIDTEMVALELEGESNRLGPLKLRGGFDLLHDEERRIFGKVIELEPGNPFPAENFFDVFVEVETEAGRFVNRKPEHMVAIIDAIPPNFSTTPYRSTTEINLYDSSAEALHSAPTAAISLVQHN